MAAPNTTRGVKLVLKIGDGADPEVFTARCTINGDRSVAYDATMRDETIPDCDNPDAVAWVGREKESLSVTFSGSGMLHKQDHAIFRNWWASEETKNCEIVIDDDTPANVITETGAFHLTTFNVTGSRGVKMTADITIVSDGEVTPEYGANVGAA